MDQETLADHLRRATRNFTSRLPEDRVFAIGQALAGELARAHAEQPPRHPDLDPDTIPMADGAPRLTGGDPAGETSEDLFRLGCLLSALALGTPAEPSWRLDGPPEAEVSTVRRRAVLSTLAAPRRTDRYATAEEAARELLAATATSPTATAWPLFRGDAARTGARPAAGPGGRVLAGRDEGSVRALAAAAGAVGWWAGLGARVGASPAVGAEAAIVGAFDGRVAAVRIADGTEAWSSAIGHAVYSSACLAGEIAVLGCHEGHLHGLDVRTGAPRFETATRGPVVSSPVAAGAFVIGASTDGNVYLLDASGGVLDRQPLAAGGIQSSPALDGVDVAIGSAEGVHLLRLEA